MASSSTATRFFCLLVITGLALSTPSLAISYNVGDITGWSTGLISLLQNWLSGKVFVVNDVLHFVTFTVNQLPLPLSLSVPFYVVTAENYANCVTTGAIFSSITANTAFLPLATPGVHYIISDALSCTLGLKFQINVVVR